MIPEESFEPIVMFFILINLSAIFQTIINKILQNLINTREVASFIDDMIIEMSESKIVDLSLSCSSSFI